MTIKTRNIKIADFAYLATAAASTSLPNQKDEIINIQLEFLKDAMSKYAEIEKDNAPNLAKMISTVKQLGDSLTSLFGANYSVPGDTPTLRRMVDTILPGSGFDLQSDNPDLFKRFLDLDDFHKDVTKHFGRTKIPKATTLTKQKLNEYRDTTLDVWMWYLDKHFSGNIPSDQLLEFKKYRP